MAEVLVGEARLTIPDCNNGGNHQDLLEDAAGELTKPDVVAVRAPCKKCGADIMVAMVDTHGNIRAAIERPEIKLS